MSANFTTLPLFAEGKPVPINKYNEVVKKIGELFDTKGALQPNILMDLHKLLFPAGSRQSDQPSEAHNHHPHPLHYAHLFPPPVTLTVKDFYPEFQKNKLAIQRLSHFNEPIQKEIVEILRHRNHALAMSFLERFSPNRNDQRFKEQSEKIKDPELLAALSAYRKDSDKHYDLHHEEMGTFLRAYTEKMGLYSALAHPHPSHVKKTENRKPESLEAAPKTDQPGKKPDSSDNSGTSDTTSSDTKRLK